MGSELAETRYEDTPAAKAWNKHDAVLRVGIGSSEVDRKDALTVFKDGRVCTAEGMVSRCGEEQFEAETRREREAALPGEVDALQSKVAALMGSDTKATGSHAVASGKGSAAEGGLSSAMGYYTTAQSYAEVVLGRYKCARPRMLASGAFGPVNWGRGVGGAQGHWGNGAMGALHRGVGA